MEIFAVKVNSSIRDQSETTLKSPDLFWKFSGNSVGHLPLKSLEFAKGLSRLYRRVHATDDDYANAD